MTKRPDVSNERISDLSFGFIANFEIVSDFDIRISNLGSKLGGIRVSQAYGPLNIRAGRENFRPFA
jgi:hypothetical protein